MAKWAGGHKSSSNMAVPYKSEEISQSLSGQNIDIAKCINLKFWQDI